MYYMSKRKIKSYAIFCVALGFCYLFSSVTGEWINAIIAFPFIAYGGNLFFLKG